MKLIWILVLCLLLGGCGNVSVPVTTIAPETAVPTESATVPETTVPEVTETEPQETAPPVTLPEHSELYLPEVSQEEMIAYFNEVVLATEYSTGDGNPALVQKWVQPIYYRIDGQPTDGDLTILESFFDQLNQVAGFPGFIPADDTRPVEDLTISFLDEDTFQLAFSDFLQGEYADGAVQYWYNTETNEINSARIGYRTDIRLETRTSVLIEEIVNLLGITDTAMRTDSIVYQYGSEITVPSDVDWAIIRLLYHPDIKCGMDEAACLEVLQELYY